VLTPEEVRSLLAECGSTRYPTPVRSRALILLLWRSGLRVSEALALRPQDIDLKRGTVFVRRGKGGKARTVGLDDFAHDALALWLERRPAPRRGAPLFCQITIKRVGQPLSANYVRHLFKRLARKAGIEKRVHPHALRHSMAVDLMQEGAALDVISGQLGHEHPSTTDAYLRRIAPDRLIEAIRSRPAPWGSEAPPATRRKP
jgi:site-specific recombinase XerD